MNKMWLLFIAGISSVFGFEKLDSNYLIQYGNPEAKIKVVEYVSLSCPKCLELFREEFPKIKEKYVDTGDVSWTFHLDPADILTLQAMVCLRELPDSQKPLFFEEVAVRLQDKVSGVRLMQAAMEVFQKPLPDLEKVEFLETTQAFNDAYRFVSQEEVLTVIPTVEINGTLYKEYPSSSFVSEQIESIKRSS